MLNDDRGDAVLLSLASRGDSPAFGVLVRRHVRAATLLAAQLLGDRDDAQDVVQDAFMVVHDHADRFDPMRPFTPWLFGIVRRLARNRQARDARRARLLRLWRRGDCASTAATRVERAMWAGFEAEAARCAIEALSPMQRACFELMAVRGLAAEEVALMHDISEGTVRQHVFRARQALRRVLEPPTGAG